MYRKTFWILAVICCYFLAQATFFAVHNPPGIAPDEGFHRKQIYVFAEYPLLFLQPQNVGTYNGTVGSHSFLYHLLLSIPIQITQKASIAIDNWYPILRGINVLLSFATLLCFIQLAKLLLKKDIYVIFAALLYTNILMSPFIGASISYDNLTNLLGVSMIWTFFLLRNTRKIHYFFLTVLFVSLGMITKTALLPLCAIIAIATALTLVHWHVGKHKHVVHLTHLSWGTKFLAVLAIVSAAYSSSIIIKNVVAYGSIEPSCDQIYSHKLCMIGNPVYAKYSGIQAAAKSRKGVLMEPFQYSFYWSNYMLRTMTGIFAHRAYFQDRHLYSYMQILAFTGVVAIIRNFRRRKKEHTDICIGLYIFCAYALVLMYYVNYRSYLRLRWQPMLEFAGVQGRYIFPVISVFLIALSYYALHPFEGKRMPQIAIVAGVSAFMCYFGIVSYLQHAY